VLCNCNLLTEGYDNWRVSCIILARPTMSEILFTQMVGRGLRLDPSYGNLKNLPADDTSG
jgi:ATP-dependent helicase IRC3